MPRVRWHLDRGMDPNVSWDDGISGELIPLVVATFYGHIDVVRLLLDRGADVDGTDGSGHTALTVAMSNGNLAIAQLLISHGADVNKVGAVTDELPNDSLPILEQEHVGMTPLIMASFVNFVPALDFLQAHGVVIDKPNPINGKTALIYAVESEAEMAVIEWLVQHGADPNLTDDRGRSARTYAEANALRTGDRSVIDYLIAHGGAAGGAAGGGMA